jgi:competence protein ComEC
MPHHLSFLEALNPLLAIIPVGADNRLGHPQEVTLEKLQDIPTCRTDQHGTIELVSDGWRYWLSTERQAV